MRYSIGLAEVILISVAGAALAQAPTSIAAPDSGESAPGWVLDAIRAYEREDCDTVHRILDDASRGPVVQAARAYAYMGELAEFGGCEAQDYTKAAALYREAIDHGMSSYNVVLGHFQLNGLGMAADPEAARTSFRSFVLALTDKSPDDRRETAEQMMDDRGGVSAELADALRWRESLDDDPQAQLAAARQLRTGDGVLRNPYFSYIWYVTAARQDLPEAAYELGLLLLGGDESPAFSGQESIGMQFLRNAALKDFLPAQLELGRRYAYRIRDGVVPQGEERLDFVAYSWLLRARRNGANTELLLGQVEERLPHWQVDLAKRWAEQESLRYSP